MPEKDISKKLTEIIEGVDKLACDIESDARQVFNAVDGLRASIKEIKDRFAGQDDDKDEA